jgi:tetratricopeptide (TPR) repeat protein
VDEALDRLSDFLMPAAKPIAPVPFPGAKDRASSGRAPVARAPIAFPGKVESARNKRTGPLSNITIRLPRYFLGRDDDLDAIEDALRSNNNGPATITALHGLRGVGKTILAVAYAELRCGDFRATWWIRAETESTMRADLVGLGVQLGWVPANAPEEQALAITLEQLRLGGDDILLIYDNATNSDELSKFLPRGIAARIITTSNAPNWRGVAAPVKIGLWPNHVGADFLLARTGRETGREAALALSEALGGLPLAHEQAAAYCERIGISLDEYRRRFEATPAALLDASDDASREYHDGLTVAKTFTLAIDEAAKGHPAAGSLIIYAALLAPEPIPLFLFAEARGKFGESLASALADDGLDEAIAALRAFALIDRESIPDERDQSITTDCIRLHRLVREVAAARWKGEALEDARRKLVEALATVYPRNVHDDPQTWPRVRRLDALAMEIVSGDLAVPVGAEMPASYLLNQLAGYRQGSLVTYNLVRPLLERAFAIYEKALGPDHPFTATSLNNIAYVLDEEGDLASARTAFERALAIREKVLGSDNPDTATSLNNLGYMLQRQGDLAGARSYFEQAMAIREKMLGRDHSDTANSLNNLGSVMEEEGDLAGALSCFERALVIRDKTLGPDHPSTAMSLNNLGHLAFLQGDLARAQSCLKRALAIYEKSLGPDHPGTAKGLNNLGVFLDASGDSVNAILNFERALSIREKVLGRKHSDTKKSAAFAAMTLAKLGRYSEAKAIQDKFGVSD